MVKIEDLEKQPFLRNEKSYRVPNTNNWIVSRYSQLWEVHIEGEKYLVSKKGELVKRNSLLPELNYFIFLFEDVESALDAYNKATTKTLPENTDIIDLHKIE